MLGQGALSCKASDAIYNHLLNREIEVFDSVLEKEKKEMEGKELTQDLPSALRRDTNSTPQEEDPKVLEKQSNAYHKKSQGSLLGCCASSCLLPDAIAGFYPEAVAILLEQSLKREMVFVYHKGISFSFMLVPSSFEIFSDHGYRYSDLSVLRTAHYVGMNSL